MSAHNEAELCILSQSRFLVHPRRFTDPLFSIMSSYAVGQAVSRVMPPIVRHAQTDHWIDNSCNTARQRVRARTHLLIWYLCTLLQVGEILVGALLGPKVRASAIKLTPPPRAVSSSRQPCCTLSSQMANFAPEPEALMLFGQARVPACQLSCPCPVDSPW